MGAEQKSKSDNYIQLEEDDSKLVLKIRDSKGVETGEQLEFDLEDIELPLRYQELVDEDKKNRLNLKNQFTIIDRKQDHKGKKIYSANEEMKLKALTEFFKKEVQIYNMFLGERGVEKLLNGGKVNWTTLKAIDEIIEKQIVPQLHVSADSIKNKIMKKYGKNSGEENGEVLD